MSPFLLTMGTGECSSYASYAMTKGTLIFVVDNSKVSPPSSISYPPPRGLTTHKCMRQGRDSPRRRKVSLYLERCRHACWDSHVRLHRYHHRILSISDQSFVFLPPRWHGNSSELSVRDANGLTSTTPPLTLQNSTDSRLGTLCIPCLLYSLTD